MTVARRSGHMLTVVPSGARLLDGWGRTHREWLTVNHQGRKEGAPMNAEELAYVDTLSPGGKSLWSSVEPFWDLGRDLIAGFQVNSRQHLDVVAPAWDDLTLHEKRMFAEAMREHVMGPVGSAVAAVATMRG